MALHSGRPFSKSSHRQLSVVHAASGRPSPLSYMSSPIALSMAKCLPVQVVLGKGTGAGGGGGGSVSGAGGKVGTGGGSGAAYTATSAGSVAGTRAGAFAHCYLRTIS